jgi:hypothetical protein
MGRREIEENKGLRDMLHRVPRELLEKEDLRVVTV